MGKRVSEYMEDISSVTFTTDTPSLDAIKNWIDENSAALIITDANRNIQGIVTGTDIVREIARQLESAKMLEGSIEYIMTENPELITENTLMIDAVDRMDRKKIRSLIVTKGFNPVGILTQWGVCKWWFEEYGTNNKDG